MSFTWLWNDSVLSGSGMLPDGTTTFQLNGHTLRLQTAMGTSLAGVLQLEMNLFGNIHAVTLDLNEPGIERDLLVLTSFAESPPPPPPPPGGAVHPIVLPLHEQLPAAFARGMGIPLERVKFR